MKDGGLDLHALVMRASTARRRVSSSALATVISGVLMGLSS
ncbi:hypothetical protein ACQEU5_18585 [Marinactinospora thermotolerans]|nr:hypothetical protein [Marinactinospora thermotolerans]